MTDIVDELRARALQGRFNLEAADEIERLRAELSEQCRLLGMSGEREAKHLAQIAALEKERDALRAELDALKAWKEEVEKQEPKAWMLECQTLGGDTGWILSWTQSGAGLCDRLKGEEHEKPLYARPVPAQSVPTETIVDYLVSISAHVAQIERLRAELDDAKINIQFLARIKASYEELIGEMQSTWLSKDTYETLMRERAETLKEMADMRAELDALKAWKEEV